MNGALAVIFAIIGLTDMAFNDCRTGCLARSDDSARIFVQTAGVQFNEGWIGSEIAVGYDYGHSYGPFQPMISISATDQGDVWFGGGAKWRQPIGSSDFFFEGSFQPGVYIRGEGPDLGGAIHFRSALGLGYEFDNGGALLMSFDHRSNGDFLPVNPGLETLAIEYSVTLD